MNMRTDPTTGTRLLEATRRTRPLVDPMLSLIEQFLREVDIDAESLKQAARATYVKACEVLADAGLEIRQRALKYTATNVPEGDAGLRIDVEFALAGPLDGPEAALAWGAPLLHRLRRGGVGGCAPGRGAPVLALGQAVAADRGPCVPDRRVRGGAGSPR